MDRTERTRSRPPIDESISYTQTSKKCDGSNEATHGPWEFTTEKSYDIMTDWEVDKYSHHIKQGHIVPVNPLSIERYDMYRTIGEFDAKKCSSDQWNSGSSSMKCPVVPEYHAAGVDDLVNSVLPHLAKEAIAHAKRPSMDLLTFAAEFPKSVALFRDAGTEFRKRSEALAKAAKSKGCLHKILPTKMFAQMWLEGRYGWRQAYFDAMDAVQAIQRYGVLRESGYAEHVETIFWEQDGTPYSGGVFSTTPRLHLATRVKVRAGTLYSIRLTGASIGTSVFQTGWEVTPYSFVIDWFIDVGTTIQALTPRLGFTRETLWYSVEVSTEVTYCDFNFALNEGWLGSHSDPSVVGRYYTKLRDVDPPIASVPRFRWNFNWANAVDAGALVLSKTKVSKLLNKACQKWHNVAK